MAQAATSAKSQPSASKMHPVPNQVTTGPSFDRYIRRIAIEGIDACLRAPGKFEKRFWLFVILVGIAGTLVYLIPAFSQYLEYKTVLDIKYQSDRDLRQPNTWICRWAVNYTYFYDQFREVNSRLRRDRRLQLFAKRLSAVWMKVFNEQMEDSVDFVLNMTLNYITMPPFAADAVYLKYAQPQLLNEVLYRGIQSMGEEWSGIRRFYEEGFFDCASVLKKCTLNGIPIDCCRDSVSGYNNQGSRCYKIDTRREHFLNPNLIKQGQPIELSIETFADSKYFPWDVVEVPGIQVSFQTHWPSMFDQIYEVAAGTTNKFNVKGTRKRKIFNCIDRYRYNSKLHIDAGPLVQQYFKHMQDPTTYSTENCALGRLMEAMSIRCGCVPYVDTLKPDDSVICTPAHIYACYYGAFQDTPEMEAIQKDAGGAQQEDIFIDLKGLISSDCAPLCDSWFFDANVFSAIMDGEEGNISTYWRNKVVVTFDPEYRVETEMLKIDYHEFLSSIGVAVALILGMSVISFVQLVVWSAAGLCFRRRLRRVAPATEDAAVAGCARSITSKRFDPIPVAEATL